MTILKLQQNDGVKSPSLKNVTPEYLGQVKSTSLKAFVHVQSFQDLSSTPKVSYPKKRKNG